MASDKLEKTRGNFDMKIEQIQVPCISMHSLQGRIKRLRGPGQIRVRDPKIMERESNQLRFGSHSKKFGSH